MALKLRHLPRSGEFSIFLFRFIISYSKRPPPAQASAGVLRLEFGFHTVVVIEHHMAVAAEADWILDPGPEAGDAGGQIIAQGPPEKIAKSKTSRTAPFLKIALRL